MNEIEKVREFHAAFGHPTNDSTVDNTAQNVINLRLSLIQEEIAELNDALQKNNMIEAIDAMADIAYVIYGACLTFGVRYPEFTFNEHVDTIATPTHADLYAVLPTCVSELKKWLAMLEELSSCDCMYKHVFVFGQIYGYMLEILWKTAGSINLDLRGAFAVVHLSNMTKLCQSEEEAIQTVKKYNTSQTKYSNISYKRCDDGINWMVYNTYSSGATKILKSMCWAPPDLARFIC
jgi:predicted HAD superfamily Cof-like phosphohydrolase